MIETLAISGYRSLKDLLLPMSQLTVVTGANGSGKSSLYNALQLLADAARCNVVTALARQGGLPSTLWAGPDRVTRAMKLGEVPIKGGPRQYPVRLQQPGLLRLLDCPRSVAGPGAIDYGCQRALASMGREPC
ncbi:MAG: AAA family ATPase [Granulosicoccus sp.]